MLPLIILMSAVANAVPGQFTHQGRLLDADVSRSRGRDPHLRHERRCWR